MSIENSEPQSNPEPKRKMIEMPDWKNFTPENQLPESSEVIDEFKPFESGEEVSVQRSSKSGGGIDYAGWVVLKSGLESTVVVNTDKGIAKSVDTAELRKLQSKLDEKLARDLGYDPEEALSATTGPELVKVVEPFNTGEAVPVTRSGGGIDHVGWTVESSDSTWTVVVADSPEGEIAKKIRTPELRELISELEAKIDRDLGNEALVTAKVEQPINPLDKLPNSVRDEVMKYKNAVADHAQSVRAKDFSQAGQDKKIMYEIRQKMSPAARKYLGFDI